MTRPTPAATAAAIREVPEQMWDRIAVMRAECRGSELTSDEIREKVVQIGQHFGFTEEELTGRQILEPRGVFVPKPGASKGARQH